MRLLQSADDVARLRLQKKPAATPPPVDGDLLVQFVDRLLAVPRR
jgi:hypothetical protein